MAGRYSHEWVDGKCVHCDDGRAPTSSSHYEEQNAERCADRQRRHDAFVAAAVTGQVTLAGVILAATVSQASAEEFEALAKSYTQAAHRDIPIDAIKVADRIMAELAK